jgi:hypothetical protein
MKFYDSKTAASVHAVTKGAGEAGRDEETLKRIEAMSDEERTLLLIKAERRNPMPLNFAGTPAAV